MPIVTVEFWQETVDGLLEFIDQVGQEATIQNVELRAPKAGKTQSIRIFSTFLVVDKMAFDTETGSTIFDGVGVERNYEVTAYMEWTSGVTSQQMILFQNRRYKIITVEDVGLINGILSLKLSLFGDDDKEASQS